MEIGSPQLMASLPLLFLSIFTGPVLVGTLLSF
jgi:hypothetical protein